MSDALKQLEHLKSLEAKKAKLYQELENSLQLETLPQEVFKHGSCKIQWQVFVDGKWSTAGTIYEWSARNAKVRARINRGDVDFVYVSESEMPLNLRKKRNPNYAV